MQYKLINYQVCRKYTGAVVYLFKQRAFSTVVGQLSEEYQLTLRATAAVVATVTGSVFHGDRDVIGAEVTYVEDGFEDGKSVAVVDVGRVDRAVDTLGTLFLCRLYHQEVAHFLEVSLQIISRPFVARARHAVCMSRL